MKLGSEQGAQAQWPLWAGGLFCLGIAVWGCWAEAAPAPAKGTALHVAIELCAVTAAGITFLLAAIHFWLHRQANQLILGLALLAAGTMDGFHLLGSIALLAPADDLSRFIPFSWALSRLFHAAILLSGGTILLVCRRRDLLPGWRFVTFTSLAFLSFALLSMVWSLESQNLPQTLYPQAFVSRPFDAASLVLFLLAGAVLGALERSWRSAFSRAVLFSFAPLALAQFLMAFASTRLYDPAFHAADLLKAIGYLTPLVGLLQEHATAHREKEALLNRLYYAQIELMERTDQLETLNAELRAAEQQSKRLAEQASSAARAKSDFLACMSHEIRTPMNGVLGMLHLLDQTDLTVEQKEYVENAEQAAQLLLSIINDILDLSKIESGRLEMRAAPFDPASVVVEILQLLAPQADAKAIDFAVQFEPEEPPQLIADAGRFRQILMNLAGNAIKFTEKGHVLVCVRWRTDGEDRVRLRVEVHDTGIGIPDDVQPKLFEKFTQADSSTSRRYGGTGLGLAISKQLVERMQGTIGFESRLGVGSLFWFELPLQIAQPMAQARAAGRLQERSCLVASPSKLERGALVKSLERALIRCLQAENLEGCWRQLEQAFSKGTPVDLLLFDARLLPEGGAAFLRRVRSDVRFSGLQLVLLGTAGASGKAAQARLLGFDHHLFKPACASRVLRLLQNEHCAPERQSAEPVEPCLADEEIPCRVLVVEDNPINRKLAVRLLERLRCQADVATNGKEALERMAAGNYAMVFMDCHLPEVDGFEATRRWREQEPTGAHLPIIALTASVLEEDRRQCLAAGMDDFLPKPIDPEQLRRLIGRWRHFSLQEPAHEAAPEAQRLTA